MPALPGGGSRLARAENSFPEEPLMRSYLLLVVLLLALLYGAGPLRAAAWVLEAERLDTAGSQWTVVERAEASGGKVLFNTYYDAVDTAGAPLIFPHAGRWRLWVRCFNQQGTHGEFRCTVRDIDGAIVTEKKLAGTPAPAAGPRWQGMDAVVPWAGLYRLEVSRVTYARSPYDARTLDLFLISDDPAQDADAALAAAQPALAVFQQAPAALLPGLPYRSTAPMNDWHFFSGAPAGVEPFRLSVTQTPSGDGVGLIRCGGNAEEGLSSGLPTLPLASVAFSALPDTFPAEVRAQGRVVDAEGKDGTLHSIFYPPFRQYALDKSAQFARERPARELIGWSLTNEMGGYFDWSTWAQAAFREWLRGRYQSVAKLNLVWGTDYADFPAVAAPRNRDNLAAWIDWWRFHEEAWARFIGEEAKARRDADPAHPPVVVKFSDLDLEYPNFAGGRATNYELMADALQPQGNHFAMDIYGSGDLVSFEADLLRSLTGGRPCWFTEYNQHNDDARAMQANLWSATAKGLRGMFVFCWGGILADRHNDWTVFGVHTADGLPKSRMLTTAQYFQGVHRLEPLLLESRPVPAKGTIGLYYPRLDIGIGGLPALSTYGETVDGLIPVYVRLRQLGYPVEPVTERQLLAGKLDGLSAMVFVNTQHLPAAAIPKIDAFVRRGGAVIADARAGWYDDHHHLQRALEGLFGVEETADGYDNAAEVKLRGEAEMSGRGLQHLRLRQGARAVAAFASGDPAIVTNTAGKGHTLYAGAMLGSLQPAGGELNRLLGDFLRQAGAPAPYRVAGLSHDGLRIEPAWQDTRGNQYLVLTNLGEPAGPFTLELPAEVNARPRLALWADARTMALQPVNIVPKRGGAAVSLPGVDTAGALLLLRDFTPLTGMALDGITAYDTGLPVLRPGRQAIARITVYNPGATPCRNLRARLYTPRGWLQEAESVPLPELKPGASATVTLALRVPPDERAQLAPVTVKTEQGGQPIGTPCTVMVRVVE